LGIRIRRQAQLVNILTPLSKAVAGEDDIGFRRRLEFIADAFIQGGLVWDKKLLFSACLNRPDLFAERTVRDAIETLHTHYEAIGVIGGYHNDARFFVMPDYLDLRYA